MYCLVSMHTKFPFSILQVEKLSDFLGVEIVSLHNCLCHQWHRGDPSLHWFHGKIPESHPTEIRRSWKFLWPFLINCEFNRIENWGDFRPIKEKLCCWSVFSGLSEIRTQWRRCCGLWAKVVRVEQQRSVMRHCCVAPTLNDASRRPKDSILSWKVNLSMGIRLWNDTKSKNKLKLLRTILLWDNSLLKVNF